MSGNGASLLRTRGGHESGRVGMVELFFDLVFVFAITQLSHGLLAHLDPAGALRTGFLLLAVWWVWIYTSWVTNWLDPEKIPVRLMLLALMLAGLVLSASIPKAFGEHAPWFACAYVAMQLGRTLFMLWATRDAPALRLTTAMKAMPWARMAVANGATVPIWSSSTSSTTNSGRSGPRRCMRSSASDRVWLRLSR